MGWMGCGRSESSHSVSCVRVRLGSGLACLAPAWPCLLALLQYLLHQSRPLTTPATVAAPAVLAAGRKILDVNTYTYLPSEAPP